MAPSIRILVPHRRPLSGQPRSSQGTFLAWFAVTSAGRPGGSLGKATLGEQAEQRVLCVATARTARSGRPPLA